MAVPGVDVERPEHLPAAERVDHLHERLLPVALDEPERHARLVKVLHLPLHRVELARLVAGHGDELALGRAEVGLGLLQCAPRGLAWRDGLATRPAGARWKQEKLLLYVT